MQSQLNAAQNENAPTAGTVEALENSTQIGAKPMNAQESYHGRTISVPFHGDSLFLVAHDGQPYVPMRPVVQGMGIDWKSQHVKLNSSGRFCVVEITTQMPGDDQARAVTCMPLRKLPGWLMTIHVNKVKPELREKITSYQNECDDVLWDYWTKGIAENPRAKFVQNPGDVLTDEQAEVLRRMLKEAADQLPKAKQGGFIMQGWAKLKAHFKVSYRQIPRHEYTEAVSILSRHIVSGDSDQPMEIDPEFVIQCYQQAMQIGVAFSEQILPYLLRQQQVQALNARLMLFMDSQGKTHITPIPIDAAIGSYEEIADRLLDPGCIIASRVLTKFIANSNARLAWRLPATQ